MIIDNFVILEILYLVFLFLALDDHSRITRELEDKRRQAEEAQLRLQQERQEAEREHERMMERINYEQGEKDKIVGRLYFS